MQREVWNKKAEAFPRFKKGTDDTLEILDFFKQQGVDFRDKVIFDIGCGNGRFALELAFLAKKIIASDISENMLGFLQEDAKNLGLGNIQTLHIDWLDFDKTSCKIDDNIDIAFASMTPALNNKQGFLRALEMGKEGLCYVGWGRVRDCAFLEKILAQHGIALLLPAGLPNVLQWLSEEGYTEPIYQYKTSYFTYNAPISKAIKDIQWHIHIHEGKPDMERITEYVHQYEKDGHITYTHSREIGIAFMSKL